MFLGKNLWGADEKNWSFSRQHGEITKNKIIIVFTVIPFSITWCSQGAYCIQLSASCASTDSAVSPSVHSTCRNTVHDSDLICDVLVYDIFTMPLCVFMWVCELINTIPSDSQFQVTQPVVHSRDQRNQELQGCAPTDFFHVFPCKNVTNGLAFVCRQVLFIQSQEEYLCMAWGLYCTMWIYPAKLGAGRFLVSIQYPQGKHLLSSLPSSAELLHRARLQSEFLPGDLTIHQASCTYQVTKMMKQCNL